MKVYHPYIRDYGYWLGATDEFHEALKSLGFKYTQPHVNRGCHWGTVYFFNENLELAKSLMDPNDRHFRIDTATRYFYVSPYNLDIDAHWQFSIEPNYPLEIKYPGPSKKRGSYNK